MYKDQRGFTDSQDNQKDFKQKYAGTDPGPFLGTVVYNIDPLRMGRLGVNIGDLTNTDDPGGKQVIWCQYLSPFYGAKSIKATSETDPYTYRETQHSYGIWAVPPDIGTTVLVIFAKGEKNNDKAFWIGCVQDPLTNMQVPGYGAREETRLGAEGVDFTQNKKQRYGTDFLPAGEKNRRMLQDGESLNTLGNWNYPVNDILADQLNDQGLVQDRIRGTTSSSAKRESPSRVFGWSTPGRIRDDSRNLNIGLGGRAIPTDRSPGHSFVMDDGDTSGANQLTRLRTASGHQLLMHDSQGVVYLANGSGKAFIEMDKSGKISIYSEEGISIRSGGDFNLHSDKNIQFHARENIRFTAENNLNLNSEKYVHVLGDSGVLTASQSGSVRHYANDGITSYTPGIQHHNADGRIDLSAGQVHFNSVPVRPSLGPSWLIPEHPSVDIISTGGEIDIANDRPIINGKVQAKENKTTVRDTITDNVFGAFVTHEPYNRGARAVEENVSAWQDPVENRRLAKIPGTPENEALQYRLSPIESTAKQQYYADLKKYIKDNGGSISAISKSQALIRDYNKIYGRAYQIKNIVEDFSVDRAKSLIANKIQNKASSLIRGQISRVKNSVVGSIRRAFGGFFG